ncbi:hypothetical protein D3C71_1616200 [compost metagenome]
MAHRNVADLVALDGGAFQRGTDDGGAQVAGRHIFQRAAKVANGAADGRRDDNFIHGVSSL